MNDRQNERAHHCGLQNEIGEGGGRARLFSGRHPLPLLVRAEGGRVEERQAKEAGGQGASGSLLHLSQRGPDGSSGGGSTGDCPQRRSR